MAGPDQPELPDDLAYRLQRCEGFLDLKMAGQARAEWNRVPAEQRKHPAAQGILLRLLCAEQDWPAARDVAARWHTRSPEEAGAWIQLAYTTRRADSLAAARQILETARTRFPQVAVIPYNLACYACQSGQLEEARQLLRTAAQLDEKALAYAAEDEDLKILWPELPEP